MAAFANQTLSDGQSTPVAHTFSVSDRRFLTDGKLYLIWYDFATGGTPIMSPRLEMWIKMPKFGLRRNARQGDVENDMTTETKVTIPTGENVTGNNVNGYSAQPQVACETSLWTKLRRPGRASMQTVKDANAYTRNFMGGGLYQTVVNNMETITG